MEERTRWLILINEQLNRLRAVPELCSLDTNTLIQSFGSLAGVGNDENPTNLSTIKQLAAVSHRKSITRSTESISQSLKIIKDQRKKDSLRPSVSSSAGSSIGVKARPTDAHHRSRNSRTSASFDFSNNLSYLPPPVVIDYAQSPNIKEFTDSSIGASNTISNNDLPHQLSNLVPGRPIAISLSNSSGREASNSVFNAQNIPLSIDTTRPLSPSNEINDIETKLAATISPKGVLIVNKKAGPPLPPRRNSISNAANKDISSQSPKNFDSSPKNIGKSPKNDKSSPSNQVSTNQTFFVSTIKEEDIKETFFKSELDTTVSSNSITKVVSPFNSNACEVSSNEPSNILNVAILPYEHNCTSITEHHKPLAPPLHDSSRPNRNYFDPERKASLSSLSELHSMSDLVSKPIIIQNGESLNSPKIDLRQSIQKVHHSTKDLIDESFPDISQSLSGKPSSFLPKTSKKIAVYDATIVLSNQSDFANGYINCLADSRKITYKFKLLTLGSLDFANDHEFFISKLSDIRKRIDLELDSIPLCIMSFVYFYYLLDYLFVINGALVNIKLETITSSRLSLPLVICPIEVKSILHFSLFFSSLLQLLYPFRLIFRLVLLLAIHRFLIYQILTPTPRLFLKKLILFISLGLLN